MTLPYISLLVTVCLVGNFEKYIQQSIIFEYPFPFRDNPGIEKFKADIHTFPYHQRQGLISFYKNRSVLDTRMLSDKKQEERKSRESGAREVKREYRSRSNYRT